jgi:steroid 5-alpha reductase family enzyme
VDLLSLAIVAGGMGVLLSAVMAAAWCVQQGTGNPGWADVSWTFGTGGIGCFAALIPVNVPWPHWRQAAVALLAAGWCLRLGLHVLGRTRSCTDDPRYRQLLNQWGEDAPRQMFLFLQAQAAVSALLTLSIVLAAQNPDPALRVEDIIGVAILVSGIVGEAIADLQLQRFRADPANRRAVCDAGLWRWSRHPNYFFEWLSWLGYPVIAVDFAGYNPNGWIALSAPMCMYWVLVHVSGIPPLEEHMLRSRGDVFRAYQGRTRCFVPWPLDS